MAELPRPDADREDAPSVDGLLPELSNDTRRGNLLDIAQREHTAEQLAAARQLHREWMREHGQGDPIKAADIRLREMNARPGNTVKAISLVVYAAVSVQDEGRANRGDVPTQDSPAGDVTSKKDRKKGRKGAASAAGPKKSKRSTSWVKKLGNSVAGFRTSFAPDDARLLDMLRAGGFRRRPEEITTEIAWGFCPIDDPAGSTVELASLPTIGSDPEWVVFGLRRDAKTGCPTHRFRYEAERDATQAARADGKEHASSAAIKELVDIKVTDWYREATPQTQVIPCTWHRPTFTLYVHSTAADAQTQAAMLAGVTLGGLERLPGLLDGLPGDLWKTDLRSSDGAAKGDADAGADLLLWLVGKGMGGTGLLRLEGGDLKWWLDDAVELQRGTADDKPLRVKLAGAPAEGGSLATALADGSTLRTARIALNYQEQTWKLTVGTGAAVKGWALPVLTKPDGTPAGLDAAVDERLRTWRKGEELLNHLVTAYRTERIDRGNWKQRTAAIQRYVLAGLEATREGFAKQLPLFGDLAAHVEAQNAEAPRGGARGRKQREESGAAVAGGMP